MIFDVLVFLFLGVVVGVVAGLLPGVHPNMIILAMPLITSLGMETIPLVAFVVSVAVTNSVVSFIPSVLLGAPDSGNELGVLPGHKMLMNGCGYQAVKLAVIGSIGASVFCAVSIPVMYYSVPFIYNSVSPYIHIILAAIVLSMILTESRRFPALLVFIASGLIGFLSQKLPVDNTLALFPIFSGFFGASMLIVHMNRNADVPEQYGKESFVSGRLIRRAVVSGSLGGAGAGFLPGVGTSEISSLFSLDKNNYSFLVNMGAITASSTILSVVALWLIGKSRSGMAMAIEYIADVGIREAGIVVLLSLVSVGAASLLTLFLAKKFLSYISRINYFSVGACVLLCVSVLVLLFTGLYGVLLLLTCTALGMAVNLASVKRGLLMGVLILPTIIFYMQL